MVVVCRNPDCRALICDDREDRHRILGDEVEDLFFVCPDCLSLARVAARVMEAERMAAVRATRAAVPAPRR